MLKLYYAPGACSLASHIALEEAGADYEAHKVDFSSAEQRSPEYLKLNPKGRVPLMITDRGPLTESAVIHGFIAQTFPEARLANNDDSYAFGDMQAFNLFLATSVHVAFAHCFRAARYVDGEAAQAAVKAKVPSSLDEYFGLVEQKLADGRAWVHGQQYTVSDPYLFTFARWLFRDGVGDPARFPLTAAHRLRMNERPAVKRTLAAEGQKVL